MTRAPVGVVGAVGVVHLSCLITVDPGPHAVPDSASMVLGVGPVCGIIDAEGCGRISGSAQNCPSTCLRVCLLLQDLVQSCLRGGGDIGGCL